MANLQNSLQQLTKGQENVVYLYEKYSKEYHNPLGELTRFLFSSMADQNKAAELHQFLLGYIKDKTSKVSIAYVLKFLKDQTGLTLTLCDSFTGIKDHNGNKYFNVILKNRTSESAEYETLKRFADTYSSISIQPNGLNRISIFHSGL